MEKKFRNKVSIIVPIYKVESYLPRCIDSIINQTYENLEIILVDDGSPDKCGKICDEYVKKDKRIKVIHKENGGLSDARNFGIKASTGDYICFIDSDDFVSEQYVEKLLNGALKNKADICACNFYYIDETGNKWLRKEKHDKIYTPKEALVDIFTTAQNTEIMVWNKIYKKSLFNDNNIMFPKGKINEDNFTTYKLYDKANSIVLVPDPLYYYFKRNDSIMAVFNKNRFDILESVAEINNYFANRKEMQLATNYNELLTYLSLLNNMIIANYPGKEKKTIVKLIKDNKKKYFRNSLISYQKKAMVFLIIINLNLYALTYKILKRKI